MDHSLDFIGKQQRCNLAKIHSCYGYTFLLRPFSKPLHNLKHVSTFDQTINLFPSIVHCLYLYSVHTADFRNNVWLWNSALPFTAIISTISTLLEMSQNAYEILSWQLLYLSASDNSTDSAGSGNPSSLADLLPIIIGAAAAVIVTALLVIVVLVVCLKR